MGNLTVIKEVFVFNNLLKLLNNLFNSFKSIICSRYTIKMNYDFKTFMIKTKAFLGMLNYIQL